MIYWPIICFFVDFCQIINFTAQNITIDTHFVSRWNNFQDNICLLFDVSGLFYAEIGVFLRFSTDSLYFEIPILH